MPEIKAWVNIKRVIDARNLYTSYICQEWAIIGGFVILSSFRFLCLQSVCIDSNIKIKSLLSLHVPISCIPQAYVNNVKSLQVIKTFPLSLILLSFSTTEEASGTKYHPMSILRGLCTEGHGIEEEA